MFLSNVQSLCSKLDELLVFASSVKPDIIALTESWTNDKVSDQQILIPGYSRPYRHDRSDGRKAGGVCCYVKSTLSSSSVSCPFDCPAEMENVWLSFPRLKLVLAVFYIPPNLRVETYSRIVKYIATLCDWATQDNQKLMLVGDFNQLPTNAIESLLGLTQVVQEPTREKAILDKIFIDTRLEALYSSPIIGPNFGKADHKSIIIKPKSSFTCTVNYVKLFDYRQSFLDNFVTKLDSCLLYTSPSPRDLSTSRMPSSA